MKNRFWSVAVAQRRVHWDGYGCFWLRLVAAETITTLAQCFYPNCGRCCCSCSCLLQFATCNRSDGGGRVKTMQTPRIALPIKIVNILWKWKPQSKADNSTGWYNKSAKLNPTTTNEAIVTITIKVCVCLYSVCNQDSHMNCVLATAIYIESLYKPRINFALRFTNIIRLNWRK